MQLSQTQSSIPLDGLNKRPRNQVSTAEVLAERPNLQASAEASKSKTRLPRGLRKAIREAKPEITRERASAQQEAHRKEQQKLLAAERKAEEERINAAYRSVLGSRWSW
jgi:hypothetical protein